MPFVTSETQTGRDRREVDVGVAGPPAHAAPEAALFPGLASFVRSLLARSWHPQTVSGWVGSLALHTLLLMLLAFWYFAP